MPFALLTYLTWRQSVALMMHHRPFSWLQAAGSSKWHAFSIFYMPISWLALRGSARHCVAMVVVRQRSCNDCIYAQVVSKSFRTQNAARKVNTLDNLLLPEGRALRTAWGEGLGKGRGRRELMVGHTAIFWRSACAQFAHFLRTITQRDLKCSMLRLLGAGRVPPASNVARCKLLWLLL